MVDVSQCECGDEYHCIVFVKANTHCLPLKWRSCSSPFYIMIRIFIRWKLNRLRPWLRKWTTGTTLAVDISFGWYVLCCWYPMISYILWCQHQSIHSSRPLLLLNKPKTFGQENSISFIKRERWSWLDTGVGCSLSLFIPPSILNRKENCFCEGKHQLFAIRMGHVHHPFTSWSAS